VKVKKVKKSPFHFSGKSLKVKKEKSESDYFSLSNVCVYGVLFFLLEVFFHLFESKWLYEYEIRCNKIYIWGDFFSIRPIFAFV